MVTRVLAGVFVASGLVMLAEPVVEVLWFRRLVAHLLSGAAILLGLVLLFGAVRALIADARSSAQQGSAGLGWTTGLAAVATVVAGGWHGATGPAMAWLVEHVYVPLEVGVLLLLAFFFASALMRVLRGRGLRGIFALSVAVILASQLLPLTRRAPWLATLGEWLLAVPNMGVERGVLMGAALAAVFFGLRLMRQPGQVLGDDP